MNIPTVVELPNGVTISLGSNTNWSDWWDVREHDERGRDLGIAPDMTDDEIEGIAAIIDDLDMLQSPFSSLSELRAPAWWDDGREDPATLG